jgi:hypothetical protein
VSLVETLVIVDYLKNKKIRSSHFLNLYIYGNYINVYILINVGYIYIYIYIFLLGFINYYIYIVIYMVIRVIYIVIRVIFNF